MTIHIRNYRTTDYAALCPIDAELFPDMGGNVLFRHMEELFAPLFFVAEEDGELLGYVIGGIHLDNPSYGKILRIGVNKPKQRQNCGTLLMSALISRMKETGVSSVHLTVAETNQAARDFYEKLGFTITERREVYFYPDKPRLILTKKI